MTVVIFTGLNSVPMVKKALASTILRRLASVRDINVRKKQAGFPTGRGCIDQNFIHFGSCWKRSTRRRTKIAVFSDLKLILFSRSDNTNLCVSPERYMSTPSSFFL